MYYVSCRRMVSLQESLKGNHSSGVLATGGESEGELFSPGLRRQVERKEMLKWQRSGCLTAIR